MTALRLSYQTLEFQQTDIHLCTLRDRQQFSDPDGLAEDAGISSASWPIFGVIWPSSLALARFLDTYDIQNKRILEVGCGIALPSLLLSSKQADITATDYHPEVKLFLQRNHNLNEGSDICFEQADWAKNRDDLGVFDLIIGSDLLYEDDHVTLLANFIVAHAKQRSEVILVDPGRGRKTKFIKAMQVLGYQHEYQTAGDAPSTDLVFKGYILKFNRV